MRLRASTSRQTVDFGVLVSDLTMRKRREREREREQICVGVKQKFINDQR